jgi:uncharacterized membrane protein YebE (DUF533 family)
MSAAVAQERKEIGVRLALGADAASIARMVLGRGSRLLLAGTAIGLIGSLAAGRWLAGQVWPRCRRSMPWHSPQRLCSCSWLDRWRAIGRRDGRRASIH